jgi:hypothetical protein
VILISIPCTLVTHKALMLKDVSRQKHRSSPRGSEWQSIWGSGHVAHTRIDTEGQIVVVFGRTGTGTVTLQRRKGQEGAERSECISPSSAYLAIDSVNEYYVALLLSPSNPPLDPSNAKLLPRLSPPSNPPCFSPQSRNPRLERSGAVCLLGVSADGGEI